VGDAATGSTGRGRVAIGASGSTGPCTWGEGEGESVGLGGNWKSRTVGAAATLAAARKRAKEGAKRIGIMA
jgi:hypothetical protein